MPKRQRLAKGFFSGAGLPVARRYVYPHNRNRILWIGVCVALVAAFALLADIGFRKSGLISNGPLSSSHAQLESECEACHTKFESVSDDKCSVCHEKFGDERGVHSFDAHYIYRSFDYRRAFRRDAESPCFSCHPEHLGRQVTITSVPDGRCLTCHEFGSFNQAHPAFQPVSEADDANLNFTHIRHVQRIREEEGIDDLERVCLHCHIPRQDGRTFEPVNFDRHCSQCHLKSSPRTRSANLAVRDSRRPIREERGDGVVLNLGVETPELVRNRRGMGDQWAFSVNPAEFRTRGSRVMKTRLHHRDAWILHNLRMLRRILHPSTGLADLLQASAEVAPDQTDRLCREALATLSEYSDDLRGRAGEEIQGEVDQIEQLLQTLKTELRDESLPLDVAPFQLDQRVDARLSPAQIEEVGELIQTLTEPCRMCHQIEQATISRVQKDQQLLQRAEFNHRAHIIQRRCLDCHTRIPFYDYLETAPAADVDFDRSSIQNLPQIEVCQQCHTSNLASNRCTTCHLFHPDRHSQLRLLPYVE